MSNRLEGIRNSAGCLVATGILIVNVGVGTSKSGQVSLEDGDNAALKLAAVVAHSLDDSSGGQRVILTEAEVNAYLVFHVVSELPILISEPQINMLGEGRLAAEAVVSLEELNLVEQSDVLNPLRYVRGSVKVSARGALKTESGIGKLEVESVSVAGIPVPLSTLNEVAKLSSRRDEERGGFDVAEPFDLPYRIREVLIQTGEMVVVQ
jgi:hypothetical protein